MDNKAVDIICSLWYLYVYRYVYIYIIGSKHLNKLYSIFSLSLSLEYWRMFQETCMNVRVILDQFSSWANIMFDQHEPKCGADRNIFNLQAAAQLYLNLWRILLFFVFATTLYTCYLLACNLYLWYLWIWCKYVANRTGCDYIQMFLSQFECL